MIISCFLGSALRALSMWKARELCIIQKQQDSDMSYSNDEYHF